jgi:pantoate--beta-alanine ligase
MGALHAAHARLIEIVRAQCDVVVVSIFVNPLQFGPNEDYSRYPRSFENDLAICGEKGADIVFAPETNEMYGLPQLTVVDVTRLSDHLCGPYRPGHFRGVATVVLKLFNIIQPDYACFGEKDYQQLCVIRRMVRDLNLPIEIIAAPTVRESDGLAMSSRNLYLEPPQRAVATILLRALQEARRLIESGETDAARIKEQANRIFAAESQIRPEYLEIVDTVEAQPVATVERPVRIAGAIWLGKTRLIDNIEAVPLKTHV